MREEDGELVAADSERSIRAAHRQLEQPPKAGEHLVTGSVAMGVVHGLEAVEVDEDERERHLVALRCLGQPIELLLEGPMVAELCQRILERLGHRHLVCDLELGAGPLQRRDGKVDEPDPDRHRHEEREAPGQHRTVGEERATRHAAGEAGDDREGHRPRDAQRQRQVRSRPRFARMVLHRGTFTP